MDAHEQEAYALEQRVLGIINALPQDSFLRNYVWYGSELTDANAVYHLGAGLSLLTQACPDDLHIRLGSKLCGNLYTLVVGVSTDSRKTSAVQIAREVLDEAKPGQAAERPGSYEGLVESLRMQPRQWIPYGEFGHFLAETQHGYMNKIKTGLADVYDGNPIGRKLVPGKPGTQRIIPPVDKPRLSLLCACTPGFLSRFSEPVDWTDGFFARFFTLQASRARYYVTTPNEVPEHRAWIVQRLARLLNDPPTMPAICEPFMGETMDLIQEWARWSVSFSRMRRSQKTAGAIARSQALVMKIALLLSLENGFVKGPSWRMDPRILRVAMQIVSLHLESVLAIGDRLGGTPDMNDRQSILEVLSDGRPRTLGQLTREVCLLKKRVLELLETLQEEGLVKTSSGKDEAGFYASYYERKWADVISIR